MPVVVVRPGAKREKKKKKRMADPTRRSYADAMSLDGADLMAGHVLRTPLPANEPGNGAEAEALAVAKAIGIPGPDAAIHALRGTSGSRPPSSSGTPLAGTPTGTGDMGAALDALVGRRRSSTDMGRVPMSPDPSADGGDSPETETEDDSTLDSPALGSGPASPLLGELGPEAGDIPEARAGVQGLAIAKDTG